MRYSVLLSAAAKPGLVAYLPGDLFNRGIQPDFFSSEKFGPSILRIRLELDCATEAMEALQVYWKTYTKVQTLVVAPLAEAPSTVRSGGSIPAATVETPAT